MHTAPAQPGAKQQRLWEKGLDEQPLHHSPWWDEFHQGAFSELFSMEVSVLLLSLQSRGSQLDAHPCSGAWAPVAAWPLPLLLLCPRGSWNPTAKGTMPPQMGLNWIVKKSDRKTTQVLERREQCASGCHDWSSPGEAPVCEIKTRLTVLTTFSCFFVRFIR